MQWNTQSDNTLLELAAKYPRGKHQINWHEVFRDPTWKWGKLSNFVANSRYKKLTKSNGVLAPISKPKPKLPHAQPSDNSDHVLNFCPSCGTNLFAIRTALELEAQLGRSK